MIHAILLCCAMLADGGKPAETQPPPIVPRTKPPPAKAGKNAAAHVQLALWCEAHGFTAERIKHLTRSRLARPLKCAGARLARAGRLPGKMG